MKILLIGYGTMNQRVARLAEEKGHEIVGTIEPEEFVQWVLKGAKKTRAERREFAASGEEFKVLAQFLEVIIQKVL